MLAIGHSLLWSDDRDMSDISKGSLELELYQDDMPPTGTSSTDHHARGNEAQSPSNKYARLNDGAASMRSDDQDRFLARVKAAEPRRCATPTPPDQEVTQPLFTPDTLFDSSANSSDDQMHSYWPSTGWRTNQMISKLSPKQHGRKQAKREPESPGLIDFRHGLAPLNISSRK